MFCGGGSYDKEDLSIHGFCAAKRGPKIRKSLGSTRFCMIQYSLHDGVGPLCSEAE